MTTNTQPQTQQSGGDELENYFVETIARYTNTPHIPELAAILARYVQAREQEARIKQAKKRPTFTCPPGVSADYFAAFTTTVQQFYDWQAEKRGQSYQIIQAIKWNIANDYDSDEARLAKKVLLDAEDLADIWGKQPKPQASEGGEG